MRVLLRGERKDGVLDEEPVKGGSDQPSVYDHESEKCFQPRGKPANLQISVWVDITMIEPAPRRAEP